MDKADLAKARATIVEKSPRPPLVVTVREGAIDPAVVLGLRMEVETDLAARPSHHDGEVEHGHEDFESFVFDLPPQGDADAWWSSVGTIRSTRPPSVPRSSARHAAERPCTSSSANATG